MALNLILYFLSFFLIWYGAGLIITGVDRLAHRLNISSFAASFFVLGVLTSTPEITIGINSVLSRQPEIFVGNLIGASLVLFVFVIPVLAILGNGVVLSHKLDNKNLLLSLLISAAPIFFIMDQKVTFGEALFLILTYLTLFYLVEKKKGLLERIKSEFIHDRGHVLKNIGQMSAGVVIVFFASKIIVDNTILLADFFLVSPYLISLLLLSVGTNLPELSLAIRSVNMGKKEIALGDFVGSAAANTLIFGALTLLYGHSITVTNHFTFTLFFIILGFGLFFVFSRSKRDISRQEGLILLLIYFLFILFEIFI